VSELTVQAAWVAGLAILAVTLAGWRKPARAAPLTPPLTASEPRISAEIPDHASPAGDTETEADRHRVVITEVPLEIPPTALRRVLAGLSATAISMVTGAVLAILLSFAAVVSVVWATNLLGR
jgi:hypothetical protein